MITHSDINRRRIILLIGIIVGFGFTAEIRAEKDKEPKDGGQDDLPSELFVLLLPPDVIIPDVGDVLNEYEPVVETIAGMHFDVVILVTDQDGRRVDIDGDLELTWSQANYINPSQPPIQEIPQKIEGNSPFKNGLGIIQSVRYDECGTIQLTGLATFKSKKSKKEEEDWIEVQSLFVISRPERFVLDTTAPLIHGNQPLHAQSTYPAGMPFQIIIRAVNAQSKVTQNYPYDDRQESISDLLSISSDVVKWDHTKQNGQEKNKDKDNPDEEEMFFGGTLCSAEGNPWIFLSRAAFQYGVCEINSIAFSDVGIITIGVEDPAYMGGTVSGLLEYIGRFIPAGFIVTVDQPATNQSPEGVPPESKSAEYCYSGEPFSATVTIQAVNALNPPMVTQNYDGIYDRSGGESLAVSVSPLKTTIGVLEVSDRVPSFSHGKAVVNFESLRFIFRVLREPETVSFDYAYRDTDGVNGTSESAAREFRCGRIRFLDRAGWSDESYAVEADLEWYSADGWTLNTDDEHVILSAEDCAIRNQTGSGILQIAGGPQSFFGGRLRGGDNALGITASSVSTLVQFELLLDDSSSLQFLLCLPGRWTIYNKDTTGAEPISRGRILYEIEN